MKITTDLLESHCSQIERGRRQDHAHHSDVRDAILQSIVFLRIRHIRGSKSNALPYLITSADHFGVFGFFDFDEIRDVAISDGFRLPPTDCRMSLRVPASAGAHRL